MEGLRFPELIVILILVALLFGPQKIAGIGTGLGKAIRDFRNAMSTRDEDAARPSPPGAQAPAPPDAQAPPPPKDAGDGKAREGGPQEAAAGAAERDPPTRA